MVDRYLATYFIILNTFLCVLNVLYVHILKTVLGDGQCRGGRCLLCGVVFLHAEMGITGDGWGISSHMYNQSFGGWTLLTGRRIPSILGIFRILRKFSSGLGLFSLPLKYFEISRYHDNTFLSRLGR